MILQGYQSWSFNNKPAILSTAAVVGPFEGQGPLAEDFDRIHGDLILGQKSWEKAERVLLEESTQLACEKANVRKEQVNFIFAGDLMNQIISSTFAARTLALPYVGLFGACSTAMESLALAALVVNAGAAHYALAATCSHNATAEKQFRYPTEYGSQKPPTAQFTVTGSGAALLSDKSIGGPYIAAATIGKVVDMGITDPFNMGAAMAPAAVDTIQAHLRDFKRQPGYYDLIITGDLSKVGHQIAVQLLNKHQIPMQQTEFKDCGMMIYNYDTQQVQAGASGCACSAVVTYGHLMKKLWSGELRKILVVGTGALLSPISFQQGDSIPCIAHAVAIESGVS
jgi:stage V sporulation protein AD